VAFFQVNQHDHEDVTATSVENSSSSGSIEIVLEDSERIVAVEEDAALLSNDDKVKAGSVSIPHAERTRAAMPSSLCSRRINCCHPRLILLW
jgi:hypothetical protein